MIGKRSAQRGLFDVGNVFPVKLRKTSFYGQLAAAAPRLFRDEQFAMFYSERMGRPSVPPSQMALLVLLQQHAGCSDEEAIELSAYDLRWAAVLGKAAGEPLCAKSTLQLFRAHLVLHEGALTIFQGGIAEARGVGLLRKGTPLHAAIDTKPIIGRGAVKDTYNLLADGIVRVVRAMAADAGREAEEWAKGHDLGRYFGTSVKASAEIDWSDARAREAFLSEIVTDARRVLRLVGERLAMGGGEAVREAARLLEQLLLQDVEEKSDPAGAVQATIRKGTAPGRIPSTTDPEQRHGRKSKSKVFTGHKASVVVDTQSQVILSVDVLAGNAPDSEGALELIEEAEVNSGEEVAQTTGDCAYGDRQTREAFAEARRDLMARVPDVGMNTGKFPKSTFKLDLENGKVTCPAGHTTTTFTREGGGKTYEFGAVCRGCPLREQCTASAKGRSIRIHPQEAERQAARAYQKTEEGRARLRGRQAVEHALARLARMGIGQARYRGRAKVRYQLLIAATIVNLRRAWNWAAAQEGKGGANSPVGSALCAALAHLWLSVGRFARWIAREALPGHRAGRAQRQARPSGIAWRKPAFRPGF